MMCLHDHLNFLGPSLWLLCKWLKIKDLEGEGEKYTTTLDTEAHILLYYSSVKGYTVLYTYVSVHHDVLVCMYDV